MDTKFIAKTAALTAIGLSAIFASNSFAYRPDGARTTTTKHGHRNFTDGQTWAWYHTANGSDGGTVWAWEIREPNNGNGWFCPSGGTSCTYTQTKSRNVGFSLEIGGNIESTGDGFYDVEGVSANYQYTKSRTMTWAASVVVPPGKFYYSFAAIPTKYVATPVWLRGFWQYDGTDDNGVPTFVWSNGVVPGASWKGNVFPPASVAVSAGCVTTQAFSSFHANMLIPPEGHGCGLPQFKPSCGNTNADCNWQSS